MSANAASLAQASSPRTTPTRDPPGAVVFSLLVTASFGGLLLSRGETLALAVKTQWQELAFWAVLVVLVTCLPIPGDYEARLTLDDPLLLAMAFLYPPEAAALVAFLASFDLREIKGEVEVTRALFNRAQIGLSVYLAGAMFRYVTHGSLSPWQLAALGTGAAVAAEYVTNAVLVSIHARARWKFDLRTVLRRLRIGNGGQFLATHLGYGLLALVLTYLFRDVGSWSVAAFLMPILVARQMLIRGQAIGALKEQLRDREHLLERLSDRILDERRDERLRVAGELHDDVIQSLTKVWLTARTVQREREKLGNHWSAELFELVRASESSIESFRRVIHGLKEWPTGWAGLIPSLHGLVRELRLQWKARIRLSLPDVVEADVATQAAAYEVVREALINSLKHAQASLINVTIEAHDDELNLVVIDDGVGFSPESVDDSLHFGLGLLQERVKQVGGTIRIHSAEGMGTTIEALLPKEPPDIPKRVPGS